MKHIFQQYLDKYPFLDSAIKDYYPRNISLIANPQFHELKILNNVNRGVENIYTCLLLNFAIDPGFRLWAKIWGRHVDRQ